MKRKLDPSPLGAEVRRRREGQSMTLEILAARSGLTSNYIGTIENGARDPSLSTILALAEGLGVPIAELLGGSGERSPIAREAALLFEEAAPEMQEAIMALLRAASRPGAAKARRQ